MVKEVQTHASLWEMTPREDDGDGQSVRIESRRKGRKVERRFLGAARILIRLRVAASWLETHAEGR
jgi:hypothetical protein